MQKCYTATKCSILIFDHSELKNQVNQCALAFSTTCSFTDQISQDTTDLFNGINVSDIVYCDSIAAQYSYY